MSKPRIPFFLVNEYWGSEETHLDWSIGSCVLFSARNHVRRKFRKRTTRRSKSSTLKGLLYPPIQRKQYHKRTTLRRLKIPLRSIRSEEGPHYRLSESCARKLSSDKRRTTFIHELEIPWGFHTRAVLRSSAGLCHARKCRPEDFCEKERYESCSVPRTFTEDAFRKNRKRENLPVVMLVHGSHERLAFEKPTRSVPETRGANVRCTGPKNLVSSDFAKILKVATNIRETCEKTLFTPPSPIKATNSIVSV